MSDLTPIGRDVTAELVRVMVLAGVAEAYGLTPHDDYGPDEGFATKHVTKSEED